LIVCLRVDGEPLCSRPSSHVPPHPERTAQMEARKKRRIFRIIIEMSFSRYSKSPLPAGSLGIVRTT
jgi:hypothetical protein